MITKKRIRKLNPYRSLLPNTDGVFVAKAGITEAQLVRAGFSSLAKEGTTILPNIIGRITLFNAEGKLLVRRDLPMETAYRTVEWHWTERHGRDRVERSDFRDVPYKRYPREFIAPPSLELTLSKSANGDIFVTSKLIDDWRSNEELLIHAINVFLELFGECMVIDEHKNAILSANILRVNWKLLPKGEYPFERVKQELKPVLEKIKKGKRSFVDKRLERLESFQPDYWVMGLGGFSGYIVAAYPKNNLYVLESLLYGNATYVLSKDWKKVSMLTKAEVLRNDLHKERIIHHSNWFGKVKTLFE